MSLGAAGLQNALVNDAKRSKLFTSVLAYDPTTSPPKGVSIAIFLESVTGRPMTGLNRSAALVVFVARVMHPLQTSPLEDVDKQLLTAVDGYIGRLIAGFTLGGLVRAVDVRGMAGTPLRVDFGYVELSKEMRRFADITVPLIVNDVWTEVP